jgi:hypothetical protein
MVDPDQTENGSVFRILTMLDRAVDVITVVEAAIARWWSA